MSLKSTLAALHTAVSGESDAHDLVHDLVRDILTDGDTDEVAEHAAIGYAEGE